MYANLFMRIVAIVLYTFYLKGILLPLTEVEAEKMANAGRKVPR